MWELRFNDEGNDLLGCENRLFILICCIEHSAFYTNPQKGGEKIEENAIY